MCEQHPQTPTNLCDKFASLAVLMFDHLMFAFLIKLLPRKRLGTKPFRIEAKNTTQTFPERSVKL